MQLGADATAPTAPSASPATPETPGAFAAGGHLQPGDPAPDFRAPDQTGQIITLTGLRGRYVVLYFYPKDITPGCTLEACGFRDRWEALQMAGAVVLGVSADSAASHRRFARMFRLPFPLLADPERRIIRAYRAERPGALWRRLGLGTRRVTYLIGPDGRLVRVWSRVRALGHAAAVLAALEEHRRRTGTGG